MGGGRGVGVWVEDILNLWGGLLVVFEDLGSGLLGLLVMNGWR